MSSGHVGSLADLLDLERVDDHVFRGRNAAPHGAGRSLFGGQVAAQALRAASLTSSPDRIPHSLHGYFLRPGRPDEPVLFTVQRERDGGSLSTRHVRAMQGGDVIFSMLTSFKLPEDDGILDAAPTRFVASPHDCPIIVGDDLVEVREVSAREVLAGVRLFDVAWVRARGDFPDDPVLQCCALTYLSDCGSAFATLDHDGLPVGGPSIDHVLWFHQRIRVQDWILIDLRPTRACDARGSYSGTMRDRNGRLGAIIGQEVLLRSRRTPAAAAASVANTLTASTDV